MLPTCCVDMCVVIVIDVVDYDHLVYCYVCYVWVGTVINRVVYV